MVILKIYNVNIKTEYFNCKVFRGDVAVDEIVVLIEKKCPPVSEHTAVLTHYCDFEDSNLCYYQSDSNFPGTWN